jgi:hypothetical protein
MGDLIERATIAKMFFSQEINMEIKHISHLHHFAFDFHEPVPLPLPLLLLRIFQFHTIYPALPFLARSRLFIAIKLAFHTNEHTAAAAAIAEFFNS